MLYYIGYRVGFAHSKFLEKGDSHAEELSVRPWNSGHRDHHPGFRRSGESADAGAEGVRAGEARGCRDA